jgi:aryl-alcohol dehydrogenase-like predicted oxidoreductase
MSSSLSPEVSSRTPGGIFQLAGELPIHRLGFGAMRITGEGVWGPPADKAEALRVLRRAVELGVNFIDTADAYGPDISEEYIAEALHPYPAGLVIATKGGLLRTGPGQWPTDGRPEHLKAACHGSLKRLKLDCIDLYQFHRPDPKVPFEDSVGALRELQEAGKIRHVGLSNVSTTQLRQAQAIVPIATVQNRYNLTDRKSEDVLQACEQANIGFMPWGPLSLSKHDKVESVLAEAASTRGGITNGQMTIAWLLAHSPVMLPIPGTGKVAHLEENMAAAELVLMPDEVRAIGEAAQG